MSTLDTTATLERQTITMGVRLSPEVMDQLKAEASADARTPSDLARKYILMGLKRLPTRSNQS
jgi:hypothetical protein